MQGSVFFKRLAIGQVPPLAIQTPAPGKGVRPEITGVELGEEASQVGQVSPALSPWPTQLAVSAGYRRVQLEGSSRRPSVTGQS